MPFGFEVVSDALNGTFSKVMLNASQLPFGFEVVSDKRERTAEELRDEFLVSIAFRLRGRFRPPQAVPLTCDTCQAKSQLPFGFEVVSDMIEIAEKLFPVLMSQLPFGFEVVSDAVADDQLPYCTPRESQLPFGFEVVSDRRGGFGCNPSAIGRSQLPFGFEVVSDTIVHTTLKKMLVVKSQLPFGFEVVSDA